MNKLISTCAQIKEWKRFRTASGQLRDGGIVEFTNLQGLYCCQRFLHELPLEGGQLVVKANKNTWQYMMEQQNDPELDEQPQTNAYKNGLTPADIAIIWGPDEQDSGRLINQITSAIESLLNPTS